MKYCFFCQKSTPAAQGDKYYVESHAYASEDFTYRICESCAPKGIEMAKIRYEVFIKKMGRTMNLEMDGEPQEQYVNHVKQLHPFEEWLERNSFYRYLYNSGMDAIDGPLGQFTKAVKLE